MHYNTTITYHNDHPIMRIQSNNKKDNENRLASINQNISDLIHKPEYGFV